MNDKSLLVSDKQRCEICVTIRAMKKGFDFLSEPLGKIALVTGGTNRTGKTIAYLGVTCREFSFREKIQASSSFVHLLAGINEPTLRY